MVARPTPAPAPQNPSAAAQRLHRLTTNALGWLVVAGILTVAVIVLPDMQDRFRLIKESAARAEAILGVVLVAVATATGGTGRLREMAADRNVLLVALAALVWTAVTIIPSSNRILSTEAFVTVFFSTLLFLVVWYAAPYVPLAAFDVMVVAACVNTVLAALQESQLWQPFELVAAEEGHTATTGLIDNPNVLGSYLAVTTIALTAASLRTSGARRIFYAGGAIVSLAGVAVSQTRTALITLLAVAFIMAALHSIRLALLTSGVLVAALLIGALIGINAARRIVVLPFRLAGDIHSATSGRVFPFIIATRMFRDSPVFGQGPGTFGFNYMDYQAEVAASVAPALHRNLGTNFGETHNDHLQVLAETGLPGYAILIAAMLVLVRPPRGEPGPDPRSPIARTLGFPLAAGFIVLALAQFPLQLAVMRHVLLTLAALVIGWRDSR
jgi:O-antigen ligase